MVLQKWCIIQLSANHTFYYNNYSETDFTVSKIVNIETDYSSRIDEVFNESINRSDGNGISSRNKELGNVKGNRNGSSTHDRYSEAGTRNARVFKKGTAEGRPSSVSQDGRNTGLNENTKASSKDGFFSNLNGTLKMVYHSTKREVDAYNIEIQMARKAGRDDIAERLTENLEKERVNIYGI